MLTAGQVSQWAPVLQQLVWIPDMIVSYSLQMYTLLRGVVTV